MVTIYIPQILNNATLFQLLNEFRVDNGRNALLEDHLLSEVAMLHCHDMYNNNYIRHDSFKQLNGELIFVKSFAERVREYTNYRNHWLGECIAYGSFISNAHILNAFINSPPHKELMLKEHYTYVGIAQFNVENNSYTTIDFRSNAC